MKLSLDALKLRAEAVASNDLLATISGGNNNDCHDTPAASTTPAPAPATTTSTPKFEISVGAQPNEPVYTIPTKITF